MTQAYYRKTPQQALEAQNASAEGLSAQEARRRAEQYGPNKLSEGKKKSTLQVLLEQFKDLMVLILIIAAVISAFSGNVESTIVIFAVLVLATKYVSVGSITAAGACPLFAAYYFLYATFAPAAWVCTTVAALTVVWAHRGNIERLRAGNERRIGQKDKEA